MQLPIGTAAMHVAQFGSEMAKVATPQHVHEGLMERYSRVPSPDAVPFGRHSILRVEKLRRALENSVWLKITLVQAASIGTNPPHLRAVVMAASPANPRLPKAIAPCTSRVYCCQIRRHASRAGTAHDRVFPPPGPPDFGALIPPSAAGEG